MDNLLPHMLQLESSLKPGPGKRRKTQAVFNIVKADVLDRVKILSPSVSASQIMNAGNLSCNKLFHTSDNLAHINLELNRNPCRRSRRNLFSVFEISLCVCLSGTFLLISTSIVGDISRYIDTAYYLDYTNCPSIHVRSYTDLSLTVCL